MKHIIWNESLDTGNEKIDQQHRRLLSIINQYIDAVLTRQDKMRMKSILQELRDYTLEHFRDEEEFMESIDYPGLEDQKREHQNLARQVKDYQRSLFTGASIAPEEFVDFIKSWLINHLVYKDAEIVTFYKTREKDQD